MVAYFAYCFHNQPPLTGPVGVPEDFSRSVFVCSVDGCQLQADHNKFESLKTFQKR